MSSTPTQSDLLIIGGSAAGVTAAVYAARRSLKFTHVSLDIGGEVFTSGEIENYTGFPSTDGFTLTEQFRKQLQHNNIPVQEGVTVKSIQKQDKGFLVEADTLQGPAQWQVKAIIIATGAHPRHLGVAGETELRGKGVTYCTTCDGPLFKGKRVVTIGGGNSALESGLMMSELASQVTVINKNDHFKGEQVLIDKLSKCQNVDIRYNALTQAIEGDAQVKSVRYTDSASGEEKTVEADGVFIHIGTIPNADFIQDIEKNKAGEIITDMAAKTSVPGIFAAGDVTNTPYKQIGVAVGQGVAAALSAVSYLNNLSHE
ncbi:MAG: FAD-dependent oxidoreductase [Candidatus Nomurabacteria bacterium]|nr:MAG: FAD-dependent oxidoreductase [Candidatus Nomurabacteria bacterium]